MPYYTKALYTQHNKYWAATLYKALGNQGDSCKRHNKEKRCRHLSIRYSLHSPTRCDFCKVVKPPWKLCPWLCRLGNPHYQNQAWGPQPLTAEVSISTSIPRTQATKVCLGKGPHLCWVASGDVTAATEAEEYNGKHSRSLSRTLAHRCPWGTPNTPWNRQHWRQHQ